MKSSAPVARLPGFDNAGEPFVSGDRVLRGIYPGHADTVRTVLRICEKHDLFSSGVVATRELPSNPHPELAYEIILEHERIPFVTYPHEWSAAMFKEAALFHITLFGALGDHGLTIKDWHPHNILFSGTRPVFVDFTSIIPIADLPGQPHLQSIQSSGTMGALWDATSNAVYKMYRLMFEPYFGLPLLMMHRGLHAQARRRIYETTLNSSESVITHIEAFNGSLATRARYALESRLLMFALADRGQSKTRFFKLLRRIVASRNAAVRRSDYSSYYEDKKEAFPATPSDDWTHKQHGVHSTLTRLKPRTVLDIGSNTGWFSKLAARLGSMVVAVDMDEASIDRLFNEASEQSLEILPLVANLMSPLPPLYPRTYPDEPSLSLIGESHSPMVTQPDERLRCEMVLALAIVHHLALGQSLTFEDIAAKFDRLAEHSVCVEFVDIDDAMITSDPAFFPAWNADPSAFGWYTRENLIAALESHFGRVEILPSHPETRSLLVCTR